MFYHCPYFCNILGQQGVFFFYKSDYFSTIFVYCQPSSIYSLINEYGWFPCFSTIYTSAADTVFFPQVVTTVPFVDTTILGNLSDLNKIEDSKNGGLSNALIISSDWACTLNEAMKSKLKKYFFFHLLGFRFFQIAPELKSYNSSDSFFISML